MKAEKLKLLQFGIGHKPHELVHRPASAELVVEPAYPNTPRNAYIRTFRVGLAGVDELESIRSGHSR